MSDIIILAIFTIAAPVFYLDWKISKWALEYERSQYDDSDCEPGFTNYPGPM